MIEEWQDNIKPFAKTNERTNETKILRENIRLNTTGIKVEELTSKCYVIICKYRNNNYKEFKRVILKPLDNKIYFLLSERWEQVSDDQREKTKNNEDEEEDIKTGFLLNLLLEDDFKETMLKQRQQCNESATKGKKYESPDFK